MILNSSHLRGEKDARKLAAISVVAGGYGGDMDEEFFPAGGRSASTVKLATVLQRIEQR